jgi:hypothetical protein
MEEIRERERVMCGKWSGKESSSRQFQPAPSSRVGREKRRRACGRINK